MIRILLVDDQKLLREVLQNWLQANSDFQVIGQAHNGEIGINLVESLEPDIVLIDIEMPTMDGVTAAKIICQRFPKVKVIFLTGTEDQTLLANALRTGAKGYLVKNSAPEEVVNTIRSVYQGYTQIGPGLFETVLHQTTQSLPQISQFDQKNNQGKNFNSKLNIAVLEAPEINAELLALIQGFSSDQLLKKIQTTLEEDKSLEVFAILYNYLKKNPDNIAALYLAGVLANQGNIDQDLALEYLKEGFEQGIIEQLDPEKLVLFYKQACLIDAPEAFSWLEQPKSPWNFKNDLSFFIEQSQEIFGKYSWESKVFLLLKDVESLNSLNDDFALIHPMLKVLDQGFKNVDKILQPEN